jgi:hypothetical protein
MTAEQALRLHCILNEILHYFGVGGELARLIIISLLIHIY